MILVVTGCMMNHSRFLRSGVTFLDPHINSMRCRCDGANWTQLWKDRLNDVKRFDPV